MQLTATNRTHRKKSITGQLQWGLHSVWSYHLSANVQLTQITAFTVHVHMTSLVPILHQCSLKLGCFSPFLLVKLAPLQPWPLPINYICSVLAAHTHGHKPSAEAFTFQAHLQILFDVDYWACVEPMGFHMLETWWSAKCIPFLLPSVQLLLWPYRLGVLN